MKCPSCGLENPPTATICQCGFKFESPLFFPVSILKLILMSVCSFGIYEIYWFYKNWMKVKHQTETLERSEVIGQSKKGIRPLARALFFLFYCYQLFKRIRETTQSNGIPSSYSPGLVALVYIVLVSSYRLPDPWWLVDVFTFLPLIAVQREINTLNRKVAPRADRNSSFSGKNIAVIVVGGLLLTLGVLETFVPTTPAETYVVEGEQLSTDQRATIESLGILKPGERILYFYSDGFWDITEGFYVLTDQALILWGEAFVQEGGTLVPAVRLPLDQITSIGVEYSDSWYEDSAVSVDSGEWSYQFPLSSENRGDRSFITALKEATGLKTTVFEHGSIN